MTSAVQSLSALRLAWPSRQHLASTMLLGTVALLAEQVTVPPLPARREPLQHLAATAREELGDAAYTAAQQAGRALPPDEATAEALALAPQHNAAS